jgi:hypothetical protein
MAQGQMQGIHLFCLIFPDGLPLTYTTLKVATYLEVAFENTRKYHHQGGGIPNIGIMLVLLYYGSRTDERDPSILNKLSGQFAHKLHYFKYIKNWEYYPVCGISYFEAL